MDESAARCAVLLHAYETEPAASANWSDEDRAWASRSAAQIEGERADAEAFIARRARLAIERLGKRDRRLQSMLGATTWRPWVGWLLAGAALVAGVATDSIGSAKRINLLAPPLLGLLLWNLAVYTVILARGSLGLVNARSRGLGPLARLLARASRAAGSAVGSAADAVPMGTEGRVAAKFAYEWSSASRRLTAARIGRVLHVAAIAFALGALGGLYVRGLALEYLAGWESTFLDAGAVHFLLSTMLAPASTLTGIGIADAAHLASIRFSAGAGENAAAWIHLYAVTVAVVVLAPRALLALGDRLLERRLVARFPLPLDDAYFQRLTRGFRGEVALVYIAPYNLPLAPAGALALNALLGRVFGARTEVILAEAVPFGGEDAFSIALPAGRTPTLAIALFSLTATPEPEHHAIFIAALAARLPRATPIVAFVDEAAFRARLGDQPDRLAQRRDGWRQMLVAQQCAFVFVDLAAGASAVTERELQAAIATAGHGTATERA